MWEKEKELYVQNHLVYLQHNEMNDGKIYAIFMPFRAISFTPGQNIAIFIDSKAAFKTAYLTTIYSHQNLSSSTNNLSTHFFAPEERSFSNGSHLIATFTTWAVGKSWSRLLDGQKRAQLSALPRVECVACFRVIIGHDYLQAHLFKIGLADSPLYPLCKSCQ
ncbi:hypothetical protein TNCV_4045591 [Trichonephila clavipes]|nr:hypothetical protein TNCV_4045591 [Trichonephila clavipes]